MHTSTLPLAAAHSTLPPFASILLYVAGIAWVMWNRMQGRAVELRRLIILPAIFIVIGVSDLSGGHTHFSPTSLAFIVAGCVLSILLGAARGGTIAFFERDGVLWQRYRPVTVALWLALIASKIVLATIGSAAGASGAVSNGLLLSLGLSLAAESAIVYLRGQATGLPFAIRQAQAR